MSTEYPGTDRGFHSIVQGGPLHLLEYFTQIRKVKTGVSVYPGNMVSGAGETEGEVDLAASGDEDVSFIEIALEQVGYTDAAKPDIDEAIAAGEFVKTLRYTGLFIVAATRADESNNTELGEPLVPEATGHLKKWAYANSVAETDIAHPGAWFRCAEVTEDVADHDLVQLIYF